MLPIMMTRLMGKHLGDSISPSRVCGQNLPSPCPRVPIRSFKEQHTWVSHCRGTFPCSPSQLIAPRPVSDCCLLDEQPLRGCEIGRMHLADIAISRRRISLVLALLRTLWVGKADESRMSGCPPTHRGAVMEPSCSSPTALRPTLRHAAAVPRTKW